MTDAARMNSKEALSQNSKNGQVVDDNVVIVDNAEKATADEIVAKETSSSTTKRREAFNFGEDDLVALKNNFQDFLNCNNSTYVRGGAKISTLKRFFRGKYRPQSTLAAVEKTTVQLRHASIIIHFTGVALCVRGRSTCNELMTRYKLKPRLS
jgi:hypothetical protein